MTEPFNPGPKFKPSSPIGWRLHPTFKNYRYHLGQDWGADLGTPVPAAAAGTVWYSGPNSFYGNTVIIRHEANGRVFYTLYAHLNRPGLVRGTQVDAGTIIGEVGTTGQSTGPHLHFEIIRDDPAWQLNSADGGDTGLPPRETLHLREDPRRYSEWPESGVYSYVPLPRPRPPDPDPHAPASFDERFGFDTQPVPLPRPRPVYPTPTDPIPLPRPRPTRQGFIGDDAQPTPAATNAAVPFGIDDDYLRSGEELDRIATANHGRFDTRMMEDLAIVLDDYNEKGRRSSQALDDLHREVWRIAADETEREESSIPGRFYPQLRGLVEQNLRNAGSDPHLTKAFRETGNALDRMFSRSISPEHEQAWQNALIARRNAQARMSNTLGGQQEPAAGAPFGSGTLDRSRWPEIARRYRETHGLAPAEEEEEDPWSLSPWYRRS